MHVEEMDDIQLNRFIADRKGRAALAKAELDEALDEWRSRHGDTPGAEASFGGVTVRLEVSSRWDPELAAAELADKPDLLALLSVPVIDRKRAQEVLDPEIYGRCQRVADKPRVRVTLDAQE